MSFLPVAGMYLLSALGSYLSNRGARKQGEEALGQQNELNDMLRSIFMGREQMRQPVEAAVQRQLLGRLSQGRPARVRIPQPAAFNPYANQMPMPTMNQMGSGAIGQLGPASPSAVPGSAAQREPWTAPGSLGYSTGPVTGQGSAMMPDQMIRQFIAKLLSGGRRTP